MGSPICNITVTLSYITSILSYISVNNQLNMLSPPFGKSLLNTEAREIFRFGEALEYLLTLMMTN